MLLAVPGAAQAYTTAHGYAASDYVTGLPESAGNQTGPLGIAFDQSDNLYVADTADGNIYSFQPGGGAASAGTRLTSSPIPGKITGLVFSQSGALYLARYSPGDVVQIDPSTGQVLRTVASIPCATGLAIDPVSGDLFVSQNLCGNTIYRISGYAAGTATVSAFTSAPAVDGLAFDQSGILYAESAGSIVRIEGTNSPAPGVVTAVAKVPGADGVAFGAHVSGGPPFLVTNRNDGIVTRVDLNQMPPAQSNIFSGGSRGDFAAVDSAGCLYITQSHSVVRITGPDGRCKFEPTTTGTAPAPGITAGVLGAHTSLSCKRHTLRFRIRQQG